MFYKTIYAHLNRRHFSISQALFIVLLAAAGTFFSMQAAKETERRTKKEKGMLLTFVTNADSYIINTYKTMRRYKDFYLTADSTANSLLLANVREAINAIKDAHDTLNGVHIILQNATPYRDFIKAAEIFSEKKPRAFAPYNNHIYAVYISPSFQLMPPGQQHKKALSFY